jgi:hypothetical protein
MSTSSSESLSIKARILGLSILDLALDVIAPTIIIVALTSAGMKTYLALAASAVIAGAKANLGRIEEWRPDRQAAAAVGFSALGLTVLFTLVAANTARGIAAGTAILISAIPALISLARREHHIDGVALLVLAEIAASVAIMLISGNPRFVLARPAIYTAIAGLYALLSIRTDRPLLFEASKPMAAGGNPVRADALEAAWVHNARFRRIQRAGTAGLGIVLLVEAVLRVVVVYASQHASVAVSGLASQLPGIGLIVLFIVGYRLLAVPRISKIVDDFQAAAERAAEPKEKSGTVSMMDRSVVQETAPSCLSS